MSGKDKITKKRGMTGFEKAQAGYLYDANYDGRLIGTDDGQELLESIIEMLK